MWQHVIGTLACQLWFNQANQLATKYMRIQNVLLQVALAKMFLHLQSEYIILVMCKQKLALL